MKTFLSGMQLFSLEIQTIIILLPQLGCADRDVTK